MDPLVEAVEDGQPDLLERDKHDNVPGDEPTSIGSHPLIEPRRPLLQQRGNTSQQANLISPLHSGS